MRRRRPNITLLDADPTGWVGHTAVLPDGRLVHAAAAIGPVLLVERHGTPGYELLHTAAEGDTVALWQEAIRAGTARTMTPAERARWERAVATVATVGEG